MKKRITILSAIIGTMLLPLFIIAQEPSNVQTIKVKRDELFAKAAFDETAYKVIAMDKYGNPHMEAIKSFCIMYVDGKTSYQAPVMGNVFPEKTVRFLTQKKETATKICLTQLKAEDKEGHLQDLPDLCDIVIFPNCKRVKVKR